ncbi:S41 family peptidase [Cytobacillus sp. FJAT-54145]|uniref:S41 family peptidase n=1 Tax=Cytobacillus spartinae TaxID=3299023 RepID=A0ABW6KC70_9BACI
MLNVRNLFGVFLAFTLLFNVTTASAAEPIEEVRDLVKNYYVEEVPEWVLEKPTINQLVDYLDQYSVYMSAEEFEEFANAIDQQLVGIGVVLEEETKGIKIISVIPGGPAEKAGIQAGDIITQVDGTSLVGQSVQHAITLISGKENTSVTITFLKPSGQQVSTTITRQIIQLPNVEYEMLGGQIGYVRLNSFAQDSAKDIKNAIQQLQGAKGWIFDLRDNGGGYVSVAQEVAGFFPKVTKAFQLRDKTNKPSIYSAINQPVKFTDPTHILINDYSASASEMVAASVKEQKGATLYGQTSYGKGSMQSLFTLSDDSVLKLTTAKFFSPKGSPVHEVGVVPNITTPIGEELTKSHWDQLIHGLVGYKQLTTLNNVPVTKTFTIKMNMKMNWSGVGPQDVQLTHLGGKDVPVDVTVSGDRSIKVIPKQKLESKGKYILIVNPKWKSHNSKQMRQGIYLEVTVK